MKDKRIYIVTGATGYVGNSIIKKLMELKKNVIGFARSKAKAKLVFKDSMPDLIYGDIRNIEDIEKCFSPKNDYVIFHTVASVSIGEIPNKLLYETTIDGTKNLLELTRKYRVSKFFQISSTDSLPRDLTLLPDLSNYRPEPEKLKRGYSQAKAMVDSLVLEECSTTGLNASILMFPSVLGPGDYSNTHMSQMMLDYVNDRLPASIDAKYNIVDIRDITDILEAIINKARPREMYLFSTRPYEINYILSIIAKLKNKKPLKALPMWAAYAGLPFLQIGSLLTGKRPLYTARALEALEANSAFPNDKVRNELGFSPRSLYHTVKEHLEFILALEGEKENK